MDKVQAETILELTEAYDYGALRRAWRKLCAEYHPDKYMATGMDRATADDVLKDINEAFYALKPLVEHGDTVDVGVGPSSSRGRNSRSQGASDDARAQSYEMVILDMLAANTAADFERAAAKLSIFGDCRDASSMLQICIRRAEELRNSEPKAAQAAPRSYGLDVEREYDLAIREMGRANTPEEFRGLARKFESFGGFRDSAINRSRCLQEAEKRLRESERLIREQQYREAVGEMVGASTAKEYEDLANRFRVLGDYERSRANMEICLREAKRLSR